MHVIVVGAGEVGFHVAERLSRQQHDVVVRMPGGRAVRPEVLHAVLAFLALYVLTHGSGTLLIAAMGHDLITSLSAALAAMSSIGPGLGGVGPASHYGFMGGTEHVVLSVLMLLGRLECYTLLVLIMPGTWVQRSRGGVRCVGDGWGAPGHISDAPLRTCAP